MVLLVRGAPPPERTASGSSHYTAPKCSKPPLTSQATRLFDRIADRCDDIDAGLGKHAAGHWALQLLPSAFVWQPRTLDIDQPDFRFNSRWCSDYLSFKNKMT